MNNLHIEDTDESYCYDGDDMNAMEIDLRVKSNLIPAFKITPTHAFVFYSQNIETIKIDETGFYWKGNLVENDKEIYQLFKNFLKSNGHGLL